MTNQTGGEHLEKMRRKKINIELKFPAAIRFLAGLHQVYFEWQEISAVIADIFVFRNHILVSMRT